MALLAPSPQPPARKGLPESHICGTIGQVPAEQDWIEAEQALMHGLGTWRLASSGGVSTHRHIDKLNCPVILAHGTLETSEFQRQTREFAAALRTAGRPVAVLVGEGYNHFEIIETLSNPYGLLGSAVVQQVSLKAG